MSTSIDVAAPPDRVWQVMSDIDRWHEWTKSVTSITRKDDGTFAVGSRAVVRRPKFPLARMTKGITERYLALEANGLKARSENSSFHV